MVPRSVETPIGPSKVASGGLVGYPLAARLFCLTTVDCLQRLRLLSASDLSLYLHQWLFSMYSNAGPPESSVEPTYFEVGSL